jgi:L-arabinokinase
MDSLLRKFEGAFRESLPLFVVDSPGRLDVFGGICEYSGGLMLSTPLQEKATVVVQARADQRIVVSCQDEEGPGVESGNRLEIPLGKFSPVCHDEPYMRPARSALAELERMIQSGGDEELCETHLARFVMATMLALLESRLLSDLNGGVTVGVSTSLPSSSCAGAEEAVCLSTIRAMSALHHRDWSESEILQCAHLAVRFGHGVDCLGNGALLGCWFGETETLVQYRCTPQVLLSPVAIPSSVTLMGIDCGVREPDACVTYEEARVSAMMGRLVVEKILAYSGDLDGWGGMLSHVTVSDYVAKYRHRLPTKIIGSDFLERVGEHGDELTTIQPNVCYKIRSRTEHHIYENDRAHQFSRRLSRAGRNDDRQPLVKAGELMYGSHWSYSQRCGLGCVASDRLVRQVRSQGVEKGIYGAKVSGGGSGGTVVVLMDDSDVAQRAVRDAAAAYEEETGNTARLLNCGGLGAQAQRIRIEKLMDGQANG